MGCSPSLTVIKLKQVEHVRNERQTLAAVAGHPFVTTLITSFSDDQCLYMLVCFPLPASVKQFGVSKKKPRPVFDSGVWLQLILT
jgi:hypothetical protein